MPKVSDIMTRLANTTVRGAKKKQPIVHPTTIKKKKETASGLETPQNFNSTDAASIATKASDQKDSTPTINAAKDSSAVNTTLTAPNEIKNQAESLNSEITVSKTQDRRPAIILTSSFLPSEALKTIQQHLNSGLSIDRVTNRVMFTFDSKEHMRQGVLQLLNNPYQNQQFINHDQFKNVLQFLQIEKPQLVTPNVNAASPSKDEQEKLQRFTEKFGPAFEDRNKMRLKSNNSPSAVDQQNEINKLNSDPQLNTGNVASKVSFKQFEEKFGKQFQERKARRAQDLFTDKETSAEVNKKIDHTYNEPQHRGPRK